MTHRIALLAIALISAAGSSFAGLASAQTSAAAGMVSGTPTATYHRSPSLAARQGMRFQQTTGARANVATPLTAGECTQLGGSAVATDARICALGEMCVRTDQHGITHRECITERG